MAQPTDSPIPPTVAATLERPITRPETDVPGMPPALPSSFPRIPGYEVRGELGRGAMGVVYKARQPSLNRTVALKMILLGYDASPHVRERFRREGEAVARLQHYNIVY